MMITNKIKKWMSNIREGMDRDIDNPTTHYNKRRDRFVNIDDVFFMTRMQKEKYKPNSNKVNGLLGCVLVVYGCVTILFPAGSLFAISLGLFLIACPISIKALLKGLWEDIKFYVGVRL